MFSLSFINIISPKLMNFRASSIIQSGDVGSDISFKPYSTAGLTGDRQLVGVADTGLDRNSCYFSDPLGQVAATSIDEPKSDFTYRKVVQYLYDSSGDSFDIESGHGTHVCGTISGKELTSINDDEQEKYDGIAPDSKISFTDLSVNGDIRPVDPLSLYGPGYDIGVRVFSNSWGSMNSGPGFYEGASTDQYLYEHMVSILFSNKISEIQSFNLL